MCLAVPMEVVEVVDDRARVRSRGVEKEVYLDIVDRRPAVGDYVVVHAGFAIHSLTPEEAEESLKLFDEMAQTLRIEDEDRAVGS